jgi:DNA-binding beta-propeller fold protein YncE
MPGFAARRRQITNLTADGAVNNPYGMTIGPDGALYVCEIGNHRVSRLDLRSRKLTTVVDNQKEPYEVRFGRDGNMYFVDMPAHQVKVLSRGGTVSVVAGTGSPGFSGDGGPAASAALKQPHSIALDRDGRLLICDIGNHRVRQVDLRTGLISTWGGTGETGTTEDGSSRSKARLWGPRAIDFERNGDAVLVLREGNAVLRYSPAKDQFRRIAGTGEKGYSGDGGDALKALLSGPKGVSCAPDGSIYIADTESHTIRCIDRGGIIRTIAGTGDRGDGPVGDPTRCKLARPHGVLAAKSGEVYIGDSEAHRVRVLR